VLLKAALGTGDSDRAGAGGGAELRSAWTGEDARPHTGACPHTELGS